MEFSFFKGAVWQLVRQMDWVAIIILIALFCLSVFCIAIIASKLSLFARHRKQLKNLENQLHEAKNISDLIEISKEHRDTLGGKFLAKSLFSLRQLLDKHTSKKGIEQPSDEKNIVLTPQDLESLEQSINQIIDRLLLEEEAYMPLLGTSAAVAPLVGLFGTIWGLIHAFVDISQEKSADIATVAPGMAEALIVTLAGLVVAIPAMVAFHYFSHEIRKFEFSLCAISNKILSITEKTFVK